MIQEVSGRSLHSLVDLIILVSQSYHETPLLNPKVEDNSNDLWGPKILVSISLYVTKLISYTGEIKGYFLWYLKGESVSWFIQK